MLHLLTLAKTILEHKANTKLSRKQLQAKQIKKFRKLVAFAYQHSPFYARIIQEQKIDIKHCTPLDFPEITKTDVNNHFDEIITNPDITKEQIAKFLANSTNPNELFKNRYYVITTSGTSGNIGYFIYSRREWLKGLAHSLKFHSIGLRKKIAFVAATTGHFAGISMASSSQHFASKVLFQLQCFEINDSFEDIANQLNKFQPDILVSYAGILRLLAEKQQKGELKIQPEVIESSGEVLLKQDKTFIQNNFNSSIINCYACSEHLLLGMSNIHSDCLSLFEDDLIFEFHSDHLCVTNLYNYTMPLIRYKMNDVLIPKKILDSQSPFIEIEKFCGRNDNMPIFKNVDGKTDFFSYFMLDDLFIEIENFDKFQIKVVNSEKFIFNFIAKPCTAEDKKLKIKKDIQEKLEQILAQKKMHNVKFEIKEVESLNVDARTGKFNLIVFE